MQVLPQTEKKDGDRNYFGVPPGNQLQIEGRCDPAVAFLLRYRLGILSRALIRCAVRHHDSHLSFNRVIPAVVQLLGAKILVCRMKWSEQAVKITAERKYCSLAVAQIGLDQQ